MEPKTLRALKGSIRKWEKNAKAKTADDYLTGWRHCPLCTLFNVGYEDCHGCPVYEKTDERGCQNTPWDDAYIAKYNWDDVGGEEFDYHQKTAHLAAKEEVKFLKSLLPEGE